MKDIESIIRLDCNEEIDIRYFTKNGSISDTTCDYSELLDYINGLEDRINKTIEYIESKEYQYGDLEQDAYDYDIGISEIEDILEILKGKE